MKTKEVFFTLLSGFAAGLFIGLGGFLNVLSITYLGDAGKVVGALVFSIGLILVCFCQVKLYTGRIGYVLEKSENGKIYKFLDLLLMFVGNIIGASLVGVIASLIGGDGFKDIVIGIVSKKTHFEAYDVIIRSILCGVMVYLSVALFKKAQNEVAKLILVAIPVFVFVFLGFEHCIANAFYYAAGMIAGVEIDSLFIGMLFANIFGTALGNSAGSITANFIKKAVNNG